MDDRTAITRIKQGDLNGLASLVNQYQARAVQAAYLILYDREQAEDIVQSAFIKAAERIHTFDIRRPFAPWFFRIVLNDALKAAQKQKRTVSLDEEADEITTYLAALLIDPAPQPEQWLAAKQMHEHILAAVKSLPPEQRAVVVMRYFLDLSEADMSAEMDRPLSTIKWWLRDARKRLHSLIQISR